MTTDKLTIKGLASRVDSLSSDIATILDLLTRTSESATPVTQDVKQTPINVTIPQHNAESVDLPIESIKADVKVTIPSGVTESKQVIFSGEAAAKEAAKEQKVYTLRGMTIPKKGYQPFDKLPESSVDSIGYQLDTAKNGLWIMLDTKVDRLAAIGGNNPQFNTGGLPITLNGVDFYLSIDAYHPVIASEISESDCAEHIGLNSYGILTPSGKFYAFLALNTKSLEVSSNRWNQVTLWHNHLEYELPTRGNRTRGNGGTISIRVTKGRLPNALKAYAIEAISGKSFKPGEVKIAGFNWGITSRKQAESSSVRAVKLSSGNTVVSVNTLDSTPATPATSPIQAESTASRTPASVDTLAANIARFIAAGLTIEQAVAAAKVIS